MKRTIICKYLICVLLLFLLCGCNKMKGLQYEKIEAEHNVYFSDTSSYLVVNSKPVLENNQINLKYSITVYSNIIIGTGRYFNYYQIDWITDSGKIEQYYHIFEEDSKRRYYGQNFFPYNSIEGTRISQIDVMFDYEYSLDGDAFERQLLYSEEMINIDLDEINSDKFVDELDNYQITLSGRKRASEDASRFKLNINFSELDESSHIDFQSWIVTSDNEVYPFYGIYHYQLVNGDFISVSDEIIDNVIDFAQMYCKIRYYINDEVIEEYYKTNIVIEEE